MAIAATRTGSQSTSRWLEQHWFGVFALFYGVWVLLPWVAPILMESGLGKAGRVIYLVYSVFCHQLPERSFFLFGPQVSYSLAEVQAAWQNTLNPMVLRQFIGSEGLGWKVAWSDRMVSFYTAIWVLALLWWLLRRHVRALPWWGLLLLSLPMAADGITHAISDFSGIGLGFRDSNAWLDVLTSGSLPLAYAGDALGSFNSWARLITGVLAALGIAWFALPHVEKSFAQE